jgi:DNA-binding NarL/FixJ family response regulator
MSDSRPLASSIRVVLVDDNSMLRQALRAVLEAYANIEVVGEASDGEQALVCVAKLQPTAVVMDINLPKLDGITATRLIKAEYPQIAVVGLSVETKDYLVYSMLRVGASEVVHKENAAGTLYGAIQKAVAAIQPVLIMEETPVERQALEESFEPSTERVDGQVSPREDSEP